MREDIRVMAAETEVFVATMEEAIGWRMYSSHHHSLDHNSRHTSLTLNRETACTSRSARRSNTKGGGVVHLIAARTLEGSMPHKQQRHKEEHQLGRVEEEEGEAIRTPGDRGEERQGVEGRQHLDQQRHLDKLGASHKAFLQPQEQRVQIAVGQTTWRRSATANHRRT